MSLVEITQKITGAQKTLQESLAQARELLTDTSHNLDARWDLFAVMSETGGMDLDGCDCYTAFKSEMSTYDDFRLERGSTITYIRMWEILLEELLEEEMVTIDEINNWREAALVQAATRNSNGITYDW